METYLQPIGATIEYKPSELATLKSTRNIVLQTDPDYMFFKDLEETHGIFLDEMQLQAVRTINGPVRVLAGAGSGKTRVLTTRVSYLINHHKATPSRMMLVTFSRKAASEMYERLTQMINASEIEQVYIGTFHSIFLRMMRKVGYTQRLIGSKSYALYLLSKLLKAEKLDAMISPEEMQKKISLWKNLLLLPSDVIVNSGIEEKMRGIYELYEDYKLEKNLWDFDDILLQTRQYLLDNEDYRVRLQHHFEYLCIDEMQDSNNIQNEVVRLITTPTSNILFVGDKRQTIYGFRNSSPKYIDDLSTTYPPIQTIHLSANYRSNNKIVGLANHILWQEEEPCRAVFEANGEPVHFARPKNSDEESKWIREVIVKDKTSGKSLNDFAVLYRTNAYSRAIMEELVYNGIPCRVAMEDFFYDQKMVRQVLSHFELAINPQSSIALQDIAPTLYISNEQAANQSLLVTDDWNGLEVLKPIAKEYQLKHIKNRQLLLEKLRNLEPKTGIKEIRKAFFDRFIKSVAENSIYQDIMNETLDELEQAAARFKTIHEFMQYIDNLRTMLSIQGEGLEEAVNLMTIHRSKGLEFDTVFIIGASEGIIPHFAAEKVQADSILTPQEALQEENRMLYVAITRAENYLYVLSPKVHHRKPVKVSRFLVDSKCKLRY